MIDQVIYRCRGHAFLLEQIKNYPGVQVARTSTHHQAAGRRQSHGGIQASAVLNGRHAGTVPQMGDDQLSSGLVQTCLPNQLLEDVFVREPMEAIAPQTFPEERLGQGIPLGYFRHPSVERCVEADNLRQVREMPLNHFQPFNFMRKVIGGQRHQEL